MAAPCQLLNVVSRDALGTRSKSATNAHLPGTFQHNCIQSVKLWIDKTDEETHADLGLETPYGLTIGVKLLSPMNPLAASLSGDSLRVEFQASVVH